MEFLPLPFGSHANPMRGAGLNMWLFMQLAGTPFVAHCTNPLARIWESTGLRLPGWFGSNGIGVQMPFFRQLLLAFAKYPPLIGKLYGARVTLFALAAFAL